MLQVYNDISWKFYFIGAWLTLFTSKITGSQEQRNVTTHKPSEKNILIVTSCVQNKPFHGLFHGINLYWMVKTHHLFFLHRVIMHTHRCVTKKKHFYQSSESKVIHLPNNHYYANLCLLACCSCFTYMCIEIIMLKLNC